MPCRAQVEHETIKGLKETFDRILETTADNDDHAVRVVHAKSHGILEGRFVVDTDLAPELALGLFVQPGKYDMRPFGRVRPSMAAVGRGCAPTGTQESEIGAFVTPIETHGTMAISDASSPALCENNGAIFFDRSRSSSTMPNSEREIIQTEAAPSAIGPYSQAVKAGDTVYVSGQIPLDPDTGELVTGDFKAQVEQVFDNLTAVAEAAGGRLADAVRIGLYLTDMSQFSIVNEVMASRFDAPYPARAAIGVASLPKNAAVEADAILVIG